MSTGTITAVSTTIPQTRRARPLAILALIAMLVPLLGGCLRVQMTMGVSKSDLVTGHLVVATVPEDGNDKGPQLDVPDALSKKMRLVDYRQDGYVGTEIYFTDLTFSEVRNLGSLDPEHSTEFSLAFGRTGDTVTFDGSADLTSVPEAADIELRINFPVRPAGTDGTRDSGTGVTWKLPSGEKSTMNAVIAQPDPNTRGLTAWISLVSLMALAAAAVIGYLAWRSRDQSPKP